MKLKNKLFSTILLVAGLITLFTGSVMAGAVNTENFNTVNNSLYEGINVGWNIEDTGLQNEGSYLQSIQVKLYAGDELLAVNTANLEKMQELSSQGIVTYSTPFITNNKTYPEDPYWDFEWRVVPTTATKPTKAEIVYKYNPARENSWKYAGGESEVIAVNESLVEPNGNTWESLTIDSDYISELIPVTEEETTSRGGGINLKERAFDRYGESQALELFELINNSEGKEHKIIYWEHINRADFYVKNSEGKWISQKSFNTMEE